MSEQTSASHDGAMRPTAQYAAKMRYPPIQENDWFAFLVLRRWRLQCWFRRWRCRWFGGPGTGTNSGPWPVLPPPVRSLVGEIGAHVPLITSPVRRSSTPSAIDGDTTLALVCPSSLSVLSHTSVVTTSSSEPKPRLVARWSGSIRPAA